MPSLADVEKHFIVDGNLQDNFLDASIEGVTRLDGRPKIECYGENNRIAIDNGVSLTRFRILIHGDNNTVKVSNNVRLKNTIIRINGSGCVVDIGAKTTVEGAKIICQEDSTEIRIGIDCMLSEEIIIRTSDSHSILNLSTNERINFPGNVHIHDHVWIGREVHVNKNVDIGRDSVVASRATVTKDVLENTLVAGLPAKVIKTGIKWSRELC